MKQFSTRFRQILSILKPITLIATIGAVISISIYHTNHSPVHDLGLLAGSFVWYGLFAIADHYVSLLWMRCYCEIAITRALRQGEPIMDSLNDELTVTMRPNLWGLAIGAAVYLLALISITHQIGFCIALGIDLVCAVMILSLSIRCLQAYCYNVKRSEHYIPVCQNKLIRHHQTDSLVIQFDTISVAELHQIISHALRQK